MSADFGAAFTLLVIGMVTVFSVLFLVVLLGNFLIRSINFFHKDIPKEPPVNPQFLSTEKVAVISAAVEQITQGRGKISSIEKIKATSDK